jgi:hypothetical protein
MSNTGLSGPQATRRTVHLKVLTIRDPVETSVGCIVPKGLPLCAMRARRNLEGKMPGSTGGQDSGSGIGFEWRIVIGSSLTSINILAPYARPSFPLVFLDLLGLFFLFQYLFPLPFPLPHPRGPTENDTDGNCDSDLGKQSILGTSLWLRR